MQLHKVETTPFPCCSNIVHAASPPVVDLLVVESFRVVDCPARVVDAFGVVEGVAGAVLTTDRNSSFPREVHCAG